MSALWEEAATFLPTDAVSRVFAHLLRLYQKLHHQRRFGTLEEGGCVLLFPPAVHTHPLASCLRETER